MKKSILFGFGIIALMLLTISCEKEVDLVAPAPVVSEYTIIDDANITNIKYTNYAVQFLDEKVGYVASSTGRILKSVDGGLSWSEQKNDITTTSLPNILALHMINTTTGYAVGSAGTILKTTDGTNWVKQNSGVTVSLNAVHFTDANNGIIAAAGGVVFLTSNGGSTWKSYKTKVTTALNTVKYLNTNTIYVAGASGVLQKSIDGGKTWSTLSSTVTSTLLALQLVSNDNVGYICGNSGVVIKLDLTTDIATKTSPFPQDDTQRGLFFFDKNLGYVVGDYGELTKTEDGGLTWQPQSVDPSAYSMYSIYFTTATKAIIVGARVGILKQ